MTARNKWIALLLCTVLLLAAGCSDAVPVLDTDPVRLAQETDKPKPAEAVKPQDSMRITVYRATKDAMNLVPEVHVVDKNDNPAKTAIGLLTAEPLDKSLVRVVPYNTALLGLKIQNGVAYANFSQNIRRFGGGSANEILLVAAIVNTLTEFPEIKSVQILVEGKKVDSLGGHLDVSEPLSRSESMIKKAK
ncbi:MAG: GerMN domain-containing protein [Sporomusaceae bacterium]|nr:GerMN domain-containing protein [Sporomusaceae bacterium]